MTFSDESEVPFVLRAVPLPPAGETDAEDEWTPAMARFVATIGAALEPFPEALAAVQEALSVRLSARTNGTGGRVPLGPPKRSRFED